MNQTLTNLTREVGGRTVPVAGAYQLDPTHTEVGFVARHLVVTKVRGRFTEWSADLQVAENIEDSSMDVRLKAASITTGNEDRDAHLKSEDFFDVGNHEELIFRSTGVRPLDDDRWAVDGTLEIKGVGKPLTLTIDFQGAGEDPWGNTRLFATASAELDREEWGLTWNMAVESGGLLVSKKIKIEIEAQALPV